MDIFYFPAVAAAADASAYRVGLINAIKHLLMKYLAKVCMPPQ